MRLHVLVDNPCGILLLVVMLKRIYIFLQSYSDFLKFRPSISEQCLFTSDFDTAIDCSAWLIMVQQTVFRSFLSNTITTKSIFLTCDAIFQQNHALRYEEPGTLFM